MRGLKGVEMGFRARLVTAALLLVAATVAIHATFSKAATAEGPIMLRGERWLYFPNGTVVRVEFEAECKIVSEAPNGNPIVDVVRVISENRTVNNKRGSLKGSSDPIIAGRYVWSGLPARTWVYLKAYFDYTFLAPPVVTLGESLAYGEWGHIEDPNNINSGIGVTETYFWYRVQTNDGGYAGTNFVAIGD